MGQATVDLPDPLQNANAADAQSADDLLSQLAGNEIDRLLAESEEENPSPPPPPAAPETEISAPVSQDLDSVLADAAQDRKLAEERAALQPAVVAQPVAEVVDHSPKIELGERKLPWLLRPLEWFSAPLDPWPDQLRELLGKVGILTLINALAVLAYVMYRRHHPH